MKYITSKKQLKELALSLGVRCDWHEPDEQNVNAVVLGQKFNNAGFYGLTCGLPEYNQELCVVLYQDDNAVGQIALATLFGFACDTCE